MLVLYPHAVLFLSTIFFVQNTFFVHDVNIDCVLLKSPFFVPFRFFCPVAFFLSKGRMRVEQAALEKAAQREASPETEVGEASTPCRGAGMFFCAKHWKFLPKTQRNNPYRGDTARILNIAVEQSEHPVPLGGVLCLHKSRISSSTLSRSPVSEITLSFISLRTRREVLRSTHTNTRWERQPAQPARYTWL